MTVVSFKQNSFNASAKRSNKVRTTALAVKSSIFAWITFGVLIILCLLSVFYCGWVTRSAALQLDIQKIEKTLLSFEEQNVDLKIKLANIKSENKLPEEIMAGYSRELWPKYFSTNNAKQVVAANSSNIISNEF